MNDFFGLLNHWHLIFTGRNKEDGDLIAMCGKPLRRFVLKKLTQRQIGTLISNLFSLFGSPEKEGDFGEQLSKLDEEIRTNPLLISQLAIIYDNSGLDDSLKAIIMDEMQGEQLWNDGVAYWAASDQMWLDQVTGNNIPLKYVEGADMQAWADAVAPYGDAALKDLYDKGYTEVYNVLDVWNNAIANYSGQY